MLSRLRFTPTPRTSLARTILAVMMALVLLSGVAPLNALSSSHQCHMACCAGKPPHAEGSCSVAFADESQSESTHEQGEEHSAHGHAHDISGGASETVAPSHHDGAKHRLAHHSSSSKKSSRTPSVASQVMTTPCSPECAAAAVSLSTQLRGQRDAAAISIAGNPRPPTLVLARKELSNLLLPSSEKRRQSAPRAPPRYLIHLSA